MIAPRRPVRSDDVAAHYDRLDRFYRDIWGEHLHHGLWRGGQETAETAIENLIDAAVEPLALCPGDTVCDVGCGYGATARYLSDRHGLRVTGVTNSRRQYEFALGQRDRNTGLNFVWQNWETNRLESASFDGVISIECLSHVPGKPAFFSEVKRVLKPGGRAVILDWYAEESPADWEVRHLLEPICGDGNLPGLGSRLEYAGMIGTAGLAQVTFEEYSQEVSRTWSILARRIFTYGLIHPGAWRFLFDHPVSSWRYAKTIPRLLTAFRTQTLRYGMFVVEKP